LASSKYWIEHLRQHPDLKVNFGHMGDPSDSGKIGWREGFLSLMSQYENVYADFGYHDYDNYDVLKRDLTLFINDYGEGLLKKIAYGSDWYMISKDEGANAYLCSATQNFERAVRENVIHDYQLTDIFFNNASRFLSLKP
jgi:predicted TIM-barrel fold metal-dependent hydrolase